MRNELLLSAMLPICGMAGEAYGMPPGDAVPAPKEQPNIILFLVDDMGWQDTSSPLDTAYQVQRYVPYSQHGTDGYTRQNVYAGLCMQHQFTYACQPFYGNECCQASSHQLDPPARTLPMNNPTRS